MRKLSFFFSRCVSSIPSSSDMHTHACLCEHVITHTHRQTHTHTHGRIYRVIKGVVAWQQHQRAHFYDTDQAKLPKNLPHQGMVKEWNGKLASRCIRRGSHGLEQPELHASFARSARSGTICRPSWEIAPCEHFVRSFSKQSGGH